MSKTLTLKEQKEVDSKLVKITSRAAVAHEILLEAVLFYSKTEHWMGVSENSDINTVLVAGKGGVKSLAGNAVALAALDRITSLPLK